ncbi:MAG TPA: alkaline phosphatase D family protein [Micromonosporaceae bacterium]|nr:alkaline phosphatase D family protein [Micromonosporaceae bacterium]
MRLLVGPLLRRVSGDRATIWVETSEPATVEVRTGAPGATAGAACGPSAAGTGPAGTGAAGGAARTFTAFGHHYALVVVDGLPPGAVTPYQVLLDGRAVWPAAGSPYPPSVIRTRPPGAPVRLVFGSCREATSRASKRSYPPDALDSYAVRLARSADPLRDWPDSLLLLGDQVYADETSPRVRRWLRRRRRPRQVPSTQVVSFEEYTRLYLESWTDPEIRWLLSTVPSVMIFDDHEIIDDWNTSASWRAEMRSQPWWRERIAGGLASYWVYQHLGNLDPDELAADPVYAKVASAGDATGLLHEFASRVEVEPDVGHDPLLWRQSEYRWSFALDIGRTRVVVLDTRASRVLAPAHRAMLPAGEWQWLLDQLLHPLDGVDHLVVGTSLPWLMAPAVHHIEAWNERLCGSPRRWVAGPAEGLRRWLDLEHWAAFGRSFEELSAVLGQVATGPSLASLSVVSGDVHHSYVARADLGPDVRSPVHQLTCSPLHNQLPAALRPVLRVGWGGTAAAAARGLARLAGLRRPGVSWRRLAGPYFGNAVATLVHNGRSAHVTIEGTDPRAGLQTVASVPLASG